MTSSTLDDGRASPRGGNLPGGPGAGAAASLIRRILVGSAAACGAAALVGMAGFWWFVWSVPSQEVQLDRSADGIVVLTGGASRVADAIELLSEGRGKRLLITGVHRATTAAEIARVAPAYGRLIACCVDLDHSAINTVGNAVQAKRWVDRNRIRSLIVVTSNYHMPRAMAELGRQLPAVALIPFPVVTEKMRNEPWWSPAIAQVLVSEYLKYIVAQVRMRLEPAFAAAREDAAQLAKS
jgi:uncharacterized SAM-binding protein YcdF (DUF218 family)